MNSRTAIKIIIFSALARLILLGFPELLCQEAYYWNYAKHLDIGYLDHPPLVGWLIALSTTLLGLSEFSVRFPAWIMFFGTAYFVYKLSTHIYEKRVGLVAVALLSSLPYFLGVGFYMSPEVPLLFAWSGAIFFLYRIFSAEFTNKFCVDWLLVGLFLGIGTISKYTIALVAFSAFLMMAFTPNHRKWFFRIEPYIGALIGIICFSPVLFWNADNNWASFMFQGPRRFKGSSHFAAHEYLVQVLLVATPAGCGLAFSFIRQQSQSFYVKFAKYFLLTPITVFFVYSFRHETKFIWCGPAFLAILPALAAYTSNITAEASKVYKYSIRSLPYFLSLSFVGVFGFNIYLGLGLPGVPYQRKMNRLVGWESLGKEVVEYAKSEFAVNHSWPIIVGMDKHYTAAQLGFYGLKASQKLNLPEVDVTGRGIFGLDSLMFHFWKPQGLLDSRNCILVARNRSDLEFSQLSNSFRSLGEIKSFISNKNGKEAGEYFIRIAYGYNRNSDSKDDNPFGDPD